MAFIPAQNGGGGSHKKVNYGSFNVAGTGGLMVSFSNGTGDTDFKPSRIVVHRVLAEYSDTNMRTYSVIIVYDKNVYLPNKQYRFLVGSSVTAAIFECDPNSTNNNLVIDTIGNGYFMFKGSTSTGHYGTYYYIATE